MNTARLWTIGAVVAILALLGGAAGLGVQPLLASAAAADAATAATETQNRASRLELARLTRVAATQSVLEEQSEALDEAVPSTLKLNTFTRDIRKIAALDGVSIDSIVPATGIAYSAPVTEQPVVVADADGATPAESEEADAAAAAAAEPAAPADPKSPWFGKTDPLITGANFVVVPVSIVVKGTPAATLAFVNDVQEADRLLAVSSFTSSTAAGITTTALSGSIYALDR